MWLIMILPALIIALFLTVGFHKEQKTASGLKYTNMLIGNTGDHLKNTTELNQTEISHALTNMAHMNEHGGLIQALNFSEGAQDYFKSMMENPSLENMLKNIMSLQFDDNDDADIREMKELMSDIVK